MRTSDSLARRVLIVAGFFALWEVLIRVARRVWRFPAPPFIGRFLDSDARRWFQPPSRIVERSGIVEGMKVLEVGCGSGAYTTFVAHVVGQSGEVHALDIQPAMLAQLARKLQQPGNQRLANIQLHEASAYSLPFDDDSLDLAYMITVLQEIPDRGRALSEILRVLRPGGILAVTEWVVDPDYVLSRTTVREALAAGFTTPEVRGNVWTYTAKFVKPDRQP